MKQLSQIYLLLLLIAALSGCTTLGYYSQATRGHMALIMAGKPVDRLLANPGVSPALKHKLALAKQARLFAERRLELPAGEAFTQYTPLDRPWVVVNLVAVPEFSLTPHQWCYPIIGCQSYRGYFSLANARVEQKAYRQRGYDTFVGRVTAYSTLGWFEDPLHTGFTNLPDDRMVALMFHELAHRVIYLPGDTAFNESFATAVELEALRVWLESRGEGKTFHSAETRLERRNQTTALVEATSARLEELYALADRLPADYLRVRKADLLDGLLADYHQLSQQWDEPGPLGVAPSSLNNAHLALFRQYNRYVPGFRQLLADLDFDFPAFYQEVETLSRLPEQARTDRLVALGKRFNKHL